MDAFIRADASINHQLRREALRRLIASKLALCVSANNASLNSMDTVSLYSSQFRVPSTVLRALACFRRGLSGLNVRIQRRTAGFTIKVRHFNSR